MEFLDLAKKRYSIRKFTDQKVEKEKLDIILEAGRVAPTAVNNQPQKIIVLDKEESLEKLKKTTKFHFNAPLVLIICYDSDISWKNPYSKEDGGVIDATVVTTHMMLQVTDLGLGTTFVGAFDPEKVREEFKLADNIKPVAMLPIGYPREDARPSRKHEDRKDIDETVL